MGVGTIMEAKELILMANGKGKATAIKQTIEGTEREQTGDFSPSVSPFLYLSLSVSVSSLCLPLSSLPPHLSFRSYLQHLPGLCSPMASTSKQTTHLDSLSHSHPFFSFFRRTLLWTKTRRLSFLLLPILSQQTISLLFQDI